MNQEKRVCKLYLENGKHSNKVEIGIDLLLFNSGGGEDRSLFYKTVYAEC